MVYIVFRDWHMYLCTSASAKSLQKSFTLPKYPSKNSNIKYSLFVLIHLLSYRSRLFSKENELAERLEAWIWDFLKILTLIFTLALKNIQTIPVSVIYYIQRKDKQRVVEFLIKLKNILSIYLVPLPLKFTLEGSSGMSGFLMCFVLGPFIDILYTLMVITNSHTKQPNMSLSDKVEMKVVYGFLSAAIFCSFYFINSFQYFVMLLLLTLLRQ